MQSTVPSEILQQAEHQASHCRVMGNPQRILILWLLAEKEWNLTEISLAMGISLPSASHHLRILEFNGMVKSHREHHNIFYNIADNELLKKCQVFTNSPKVELIKIQQV
jgi:predicted transcriptional regulator